jgi:hypothetical protein
MEKELFVKKFDFENSYITNIGDKLTEDLFKDTTVFIKFDFQAFAFLQNSSIDHAWNYNDKFNYGLVPVIYGRGAKDLTFYVSFMGQNAKSDIVDDRKTYFGETQIGHWGDFEIAKIVYDTENFYLKFGRDYFIPGLCLYENMFFSRYQYPYDQLYVAYRNHLLEISSFYLRLNDMIDEGDNYLRHINGHRLSINLFNRGHIAFNEVLLYTGIQRPINLSLFNPLLIYYLYQRNENIESTNTMMSMDFLYKFGKLYISGEFILDDFMTEREVYSDLEPTKYGINITLGVKDIIPGLNWSINHTRIANRVYSTMNSRINVEKFIYDNLPIGFYMGSNLYEINSRISFIKQKYQGDIQFVYRVSGDDVVYSPYNIDHYQGHEWSDPLEPGATWNEPFPYVSDGSDPLIFWGFKTNQYYQIMKHFGLNIKAAYWIEKGLLKNHFNIAGGLYLNL